MTGFSDHRLLSTMYVTSSHRTNGYTSASRSVALEPFSRFLRRDLSRLWRAHRHTLWYCTLAPVQ